MVYTDELKYNSEFLRQANLFFKPNKSKRLTFAVINGFYTRHINDYSFFETSYMFFQEIANKNILMVNEKLPP